MEQQEQTIQLDVQQIAEALNTNEELRGQILETISSTEAGQSYLNKYASNYLEQKAGTIRGELYGNIDKDLKELGFEKPEGVKTYAYLKDVVSQLKQKASSSDPSKYEALEKKYNEALSKIENNQEAKYFKDLHETTKNDLMKQLEEKDGLINEFHNKQRLFSIEGELNKALSKLTLNDTLPEDVRATYIKTVYDSLLNEAKVLEDGSIAFYGNGELITNKKTASKATAEEILNDRLKSIIAQKADASGGGGQGDFQKKKPSNINLSNARTKLELNGLAEASLLKDGLLKGSTEFITKMDEIMAEYGKNLPLR